MSKAKSALEKTFKGNSPALISSIILIALGLLLVIMPNIASTLVFVSIGVMLVVIGIINIIRYLQMDTKQVLSSYALSIGIISFVGGILIMIFRPLLLASVPFICGGIIAAGGVLQLQKSLQLKKMNVRLWYIDIIVAGLLLAAGTLILVNPFKTAMLLTRIIGIALMFEGILSIISGAVFEKKKKTFLTEFKEEKE